MRHVVMFSGGLGSWATAKRVAEQLNLRRNTLAVAVHRLRARLRELIEDELAETTTARDELDDELRDLRGALGAAAA